MEYINRLLHRNSPNNSTSNSPEPLAVNDSAKLPEHEVKVKFAREFTDASHAPETNSISSASSFQSLASTVSSIPTSPTRADASYTNLEVSGLDDLISACAGIRLEDTLTADQSLFDASFASASDEPIHNRTTDLPNDAPQSLGADLNGTQVLSGRSSPLGLTEQQLNPEAPQLTCPNVTITLPNDHVNSPEYQTAPESLLQTSSSNPQGRKTPELNQSTTTSSVADTTYQKISVGDVTFDSECPSLPTLQSICLKSSGEFKEPFPVKDPKRSVSPQPQPQPDQPDSCAVDSASKAESSASLKIPDTSGHCIPFVTEPTFVEGQKALESSNEPSLVPEESSTEFILASTHQPIEASGSPPEVVFTESQEPPNTLEAPLEETSDPEELDRTITLQETDDILDVPESEQYEAFKPQRQSTETHPRPFPPIPTPSDYLDFLPKRQSTGLDYLPPPNDFQSADSEDKTPTAIDNDQRFFDATDDITPTSQNPEEPSGVFEKLRLEAETIAHEIINASLELTEDNDNLASANSNELFRDPSTFDFFESQTSARSTVDRLRESLFIKFDPLVSNVSMLPQGNAASPPNDERNGDKDSEALPSITTPKRNPAIAAIDRLLFYSPMPAAAIQKHEEVVEKIEVVEKTPEPVPVVDLAMAKELELVRSTVLQLEEQLEKEKMERERERCEAEKQRESFNETVSQLQRQLAQEIKNKNQINVVVDEYEKSISRLVAERERDKKSLDGEKGVLMEELQETKDHLMASEAAFNDVHAKYERLKIVVTTLKSNESALKESLAENVEIIKALENRYEQIKSHAAARLEKANQDLDVIRKQHESEMVKLRAILRKEELKSNSLTEIVEQKTKENKELTQILDEVIARVGAKSDE
ncbi:transforming acidic coiled-coil-containing protein 3 isoform X2 [Diachasma alloeum]|uniref:transforming acidic coiled-coil-containing protein 3 isoform X2 n=1 Tax=Diachasma alloeum TaxID=454923 RepID=UPI0007384388|nr:transforming acidic coiled-coil-containing protein 3 isoform X2 [Diachasma alloeum]